MSDVNCTFDAKMTNNYLDVHKFSPPRFKITESASGTVTVTIWCALASGAFYRNGTGVMKVSCLYLEAEENCDGEIAFELVPWELTYELSLSPGEKIEEIFFRDEQTIDINEPFETIELQVDDLVALE